MDNNRVKLAILLTFICYMVWGGGVIAMKFALRSFDAIQIMTTRALVPTLFYLCLYRRWIGIKVRSGDWKYLLLLTFCEPCMFFFCITNGVKLTTASEAGIITAAFPLVTALGAWLFLGERMRATAIAGLLAAITGIAGMSFFSAQSEFASNPLLGNLLIFLGLVFSAGYTLCARVLAPSYPGMFISAIQAIGGSLVFTPICLMRPAPHDITPSSVLGLAYLGICIGIGVYLTFNWAMRWVRASMAGILSNITPVCTLVLAWLVLGERLQPGQMPCMILALAGVAVAGISFGRSRRKDP